MLKKKEKYNILIYFFVSETQIWQIDTLKSMEVIQNLDSRVTKNAIIPRYTKLA